MLCDDRDRPWMNDRIKHLIKKKKDLFQKQKEPNTVDHAILSDITREKSFLKLNIMKDLQLNDPKTAPETYWSILKAFVNSSKIPLIPPLLVNNEFVTDFLVKANLFNDFFREQCRPITKNSSLPNSQIIETVTRLSDITIDTDTIINLKLCATSISKPLHILFNNSVINVFQMNGKKQIFSQFIKNVTNR